MATTDSVWNRIIHVVVTCAAASSTTTAHAQSAAAAEIPEEVVVTAQRRTYDLQEAAVSASVLSGDLLEDKGVVDLNTIQYAVPSVTISSFGSANVFNVRGIGRSQADIDVPSGVVIYRDGAATLAGYFQNEPYFDIASVEVLRGPQGTFGGKSAAGGAVFITTNNPQFDRFYGSVEAGIANFDSKQATAILNAPVSDTLAARVVFNHYDRNTFYDSITGNYTGHPDDRNLNSFRVSMLWEPNDQFKGLVKVDYHDLDFGGNVTTSYGHEPLGDVEQNADFVYTDESLRAVLDLKYRFNNGIVLSSLTGHQDVDSQNNNDLNGTEPLYYEFQSKFNANIVSQEVNLISPEERRFRWITGLFLQRQKVHLYDWDQGGFTFTGNVDGVAVLGNDYPWLASPWIRKDDDWAVFGQIQQDLTDKLELEVGVRYSDYEMSQFTQYRIGDGTVPLELGYPSVAPYLTLPEGETQTLGENSVDYSVALNWAASDRHFVYGLVSRGHITGGINIFPPFIQYDEMEVINFEGGWKGNWLADQLRTQFSAYYQTFDNYQASFGNLDGLTSTNRNASSQSHIWGLELSGQARISNWTVDFAAAYMSSKLGDFKNVLDPFQNVIVDLTGARSPFSPELTGNLGVSYEVQFGKGYTLRPRIDTSYISETQGALWSSELVTLEARALVNAQLVLEPPSGRWTTTFWIHNAADKHYVGGIQNSGTLRYAGAPRQFGVRVKFDF